MIKKLLLAFLGLIAVLIIALYFFGSTLLNNGVKKGVETIGPKVTQTSVTLESVDLSIFSGEGTLKGLNIANPDGYKSEYIFALGEIDVGIQVGTILSDKIIIDRVIIKQPQISYETNLATSNVKQLLKNIEAFTGGQTEEPVPADETPADETGAQKQVVIKQVLVEDGTVYVGVLGAGQSVKLPRIELTNVGENRNLTIAQALNIVVTEVLKAIGPAVSDASGLLKDGGKALLEGDAEAVKKASDSIKSLFGK